MSAKVIPFPSGRGPRKRRRDAAEAAPGGDVPAFVNGFSITAPFYGTAAVGGTSVTNYVFGPGGSYQVQQGMLPPLMPSNVLADPQWWQFINGRSNRVAHRLVAWTLDDQGGIVWSTACGKRSAHAYRPVRGERVAKCRRCRAKGWQ